MPGPGILLHIVRVAVVFDTPYPLEITTTTSATWTSSDFIQRIVNAAVTRYEPS
jgi:hypothetical protein